MKQLISAAQNGDRQAIAELYRSNIGWVFRYVRARVHNDQVAEDVVSIVFIKAFENIAKFRAESSFKTWLFRITSNEIKNSYRDTSRTVPLEIEVLDRNEDKSEDVAPDQEQIKLMYQVLEKLNPRYREVLELRYISGLSVKDSAEALNIKQNALKVLQHRALAQAKKLANIQ